MPRKPRRRDAETPRRRDAETPRRRDPCLKIRDRDWKVLTKSEPETLYKENRPRDFILRKLFAARHELHDILR